MTTPAETDVLVVGAGPTGLMLGCQLARRGVRSMVIDRNDGPSRHSKALVVHARTLEIYDRLGIAEEALNLGARAEGANMWVKGRHAARVPIGDIGRDLSPFPFLLILGQDDNERLLGARLRELGGEVRWNTELVAVDERDGEVIATLKQPDGTSRTCRARWIAGCDGAHSTVRHQAGIDFPGAPYEQVFFVADTTMHGPMAPGEINVFVWREGFHLFFPMGREAHWRLVGILPRALVGREDLTFETVATSLRKEVPGLFDIKDCHWFSIYRIHHRHAARFREKRCFVLGDAAHIHSPVGAQGMNTGLQDAYNLAWKLALVVTGQAKETLLDSYQAERLPVADRLLNTTDRAFTFVVSKGLAGALFRTQVVSRILAFAMGQERARRLAFRTISQIGISYRQSPLSLDLPDRPSRTVRAGDRFPWLRLRLEGGKGILDLFDRLDDCRFNLIVIGQPAPRQDLRWFADQLIVHEVADDSLNDQALAKAGLPKPSFYLLRPDGHVGLAGGRLDRGAAERYLSDCLAATPLAV